MAVRRFQRLDPVPLFVIDETFIMFYNSTVFSNIIKMWFIEELINY